MTSWMAHPRILAVGVLLLVGGTVLGLVANPILLSAIGWGLFGVGGVVLLSLVFLLVGESEDRDRLRNPNG